MAETLKVKLPSSNVCKNQKYLSSVVQPHAIVTDYLWYFQICHLGYWAISFSIFWEIVRRKLPAVKHHIDIIIASTKNLSSFRLPCIAKHLFNAHQKSKVLIFQICQTPWCMQSITSLSASCRASGNRIHKAELNRWRSSLVHLDLVMCELPNFALQIQDALCSASRAPIPRPVREGALALVPNSLQYHGSRCQHVRQFKQIQTHSCSALVGGKA